MASPLFSQPMQTPWRQPIRRPAKLRRAALAPVVAACGLAAGCATTVGVQQNDPRETYDQIAVSAVGVDDCSRFSEDVPTRYDKVQAFAEAPLQGLAFLHHEAEKDSRNDSPFALAELNYFIAVRQRQGGVEKSRPHFLASAIYASLYLLSQDWIAPPNPFDRRFRIACDLYNNSLAQALTNSDGNLQFAPAKVDLPVGRFAFSVDASQFHQSFDQFEKFLSADNFGVSGLSRRNREAGMGGGHHCR